MAETTITDVKQSAEQKMGKTLEALKNDLGKVRADKLDIDPNVWTPGHVGIIKAAAEDPKVERILVNAAIKKALCREAGSDRGWLTKVRPG